MNKEEQAAARDILKYIQKHPQSKHSVQGIARYWISQERLEERLEIVLAAIDHLVREGFLEALQKEDKSCFYRVCEKKLDEISSEIEKLAHQ